MCRVGVTQPGPRNWNISCGNLASRIAAIDLVHHPRLAEDARVMPIMRKARVSILAAAETWEQAKNIGRSSMGRRRPTGRFRARVVSSFFLRPLGGRRSLDSTPWVFDPWLPSVTCFAVNYAAIQDPSLIKSTFPAVFDASLRPPRQLAGDRWRPRGAKQAAVAT
jgi:hypothetical protein